MIQALLTSLAIFCAVAAILEFACLRDPRIVDSNLSSTGRRLVAVGWTLFSVRCGYLVFSPGAAAFAPTDEWRVVGLLSLNLVALGRIMITSHQIDALKFFAHRSERRRIRSE